MSEESNKFNTSQAAVAEAASVAAFPPYEVESWVDAAKRGAGRPDHFTTDHLLTNLKGRTVSSVFVTVAAVTSIIVCSG